ncbi:MlaD family protein [Nitrospinaceae bacterium]|nr:MlaD family protein [Nitrospinaceae bacterium]
MEISNPQVSKQAGLSIVWIIPLVTLLVGGWLIVKTLSEQGPRATISFKTAEGIEVGKTRIKYKNVDIGVVEKIKFSDDFSNIILTVDFMEGSEKFLRRSTRFWVVKPQLSLRGATGLSTIISGAYIEIEPGTGAPKLHFIGLEKQPVVKSDEQGKKITLVTQKLGSVDTGSPIYYQGLIAGEVLGYELGNDRKSTYVHTFIKDPFDQLIRGNTNFWNVSGINVSMGADGFKVQTESIQSMLFGGIAFESPETLEQATTDIDKLVFTLHESYESIKKHAYTKKIKFIMFFDSSIRGLNLGAPVEFKGIKVGTVLDVRLEFDSGSTSFRIPVLIEIEPQRIIERGNQEMDQSHQALQRLVKRGLRARLQTGSLLTSQLFVELDMHPGSPINLSGSDTPYPELPTLPTSNFGAITQSAEDLLAKLNAVDIKEVTSVLIDTIKTANKTMHNADKAIESANTLIGTPGIPEAIENIRITLKNFKNITQKVDDSNLIASATKTFSSVDKTINSADKAINNANTLISAPGIPEAIEDIRIALKNFKNITQKVNDTNLIASASKTLSNVGEIITKSNQTLSNANKAIDSMISTADNANKLITSPGITESIEDIRVSLKNFKSIMLKVDNSKIQEAIAAGHLALENLSQTLDKTSKMMEPNSPIQYNLIELTKEFEETSRAIRSLIETLERNPQELIFGKDRNAKGE